MQRTAAMAACLLVFVLDACQKGAAPAAFERPPAPVTVVTAVTRNVPIYLDEIGKCAAQEVVTVQPQVSGRITEIHFTEGADIKKGDLLYVIDPRPFQADLASAEATLAQRKAALDLAKIDFARIADLADSKAIARQDYDTKKNAIDVAEAQVKQSEAAIESAKLALDYTSIRSPIDGRAGERLVDLGNVVNANATPLLVIQRLDPIYADFTITEGDLTGVQQNMSRGSLRVEVRLPDDPDHPRDGRLSFLDNAVQEGTGTVRLRATIDNADHRFWPGRFVKVRLILSTVPNAVLVPASAAQMSANGPFVYVVKTDSTADLRPITLGQRQGDLVMVSSGLTAGEQVVLTGHIGVMPGGKVRVVPLEQTAPQQAAPAGQAGGEKKASDAGGQS